MLAYAALVLLGLCAGAAVGGSRLFSRTSDRSRARMSRHGSPAALAPVLGATTASNSLAGGTDTPAGQGSTVRRPLLPRHAGTGNPAASTPTRPLRLPHAIEPPLQPPSSHVVLQSPTTGPTTPSVTIPHIPTMPSVPTGDPTPTLTRTVTVTVTTPASSTPTPVTATPVASTAPAAVALAPGAVRLYNPFNLPADRLGKPALAIDGDPTTTWTVQPAPTAGDVIDAGLLLDLGSARKLTTLKLTTPSAGMAIEIFAASRKVTGSTVSWHWTSLASSRHLRAHAKLTLDTSGRAFRHLLVWIWSAPRGNAGEPVGISSLSVFAKHQP